MGRTRSHNTLCSQMIRSIDNSFCPGVSKRQDKINGNYYPKSKVYSYSERKALIATAKDFSHWIKTNYPQNKMMKTIDSQIVGQYLKSKQETCTTNTIKAIAHRLDKIANTGSTMFNCPMNWGKVDIPKGKETLRTIAMKENDYQKIVSCLSSSYGKIAVELSHAFGLRVSECVNIRVCDIKGNKLIIYKSKGGKTRELYIKTAEQKEVIKKLHNITNEKGLSNHDKILPIKSQSANKWLRDRCKQLNITKYNSHKTSFHAIRKNWAIREYQQELKNTQGDTKKAWSHVCIKLGHGKDREDLRKVYLPKN